MPPLLFAALSIPFTRLAYILFPVPMANGIIAGSYTFCKHTQPNAHIYSPSHPTNSSLSDVLYDCMHYAYVHSQSLPTFTDISRIHITSHSLHHTALPAYMREMKKYHLAHHYKNFELGFGVTSACFFNYSIFVLFLFIYLREYNAHRLFVFPFFRQNLGLRLQDYPCRLSKSSFSRSLVVRKRDV